MTNTEDCWWGWAGAAHWFCHRRGAEWDGALARELHDKHDMQSTQFSGLLVCLYAGRVPEGDVLQRVQGRGEAQARSRQDRSRQARSTPSQVAQAKSPQAKSRDLAWADLAWRDLGWGKTQPKSRVSLRGGYHGVSNVHSNKNPERVRMCVLKCSRHA